MTFAQLRVLVAVAETGGFTPAAERLGISQPAASRAVAQLERELGAPLLSRRPVGVILTEAGRRALEHARESLRHADRMRQVVADATGDLRGPLTIASFPTATAQLLPPLLQALGDRHPGVRTQLLEGTDQEVRAWLDGGAADVAMVTLPAGRLDTLALAQDELVAVLPAGHALAGRPAVALGALAGEPFVLSSGGCGPLITSAARAAGVRLDVAYEVRDVATILTMVETGLGVSVMPTLSLVGAAHAVATAPLDPPVPRRLALATRAGEPPSPAASALLELAGHVTPAAPATTTPGAPRA